MKARFISELVEGSTVDATFLLRSREMRAARTGDAYLALELADRTGMIPAVHFRPKAEAASVPTGTVVHVNGTVTTFRGVRRISVSELRPADNWDPADLIGQSVRPVGELVARFNDLVRSVDDPDLRRLLRAVFGDNEFFKSFCACPASQSYHHSYSGGLLEHTVDVASTCDSLAERYDGVDRGLLIAASLLHDIGKVDELSVGAGIGYTDSGRLVGHVVSGAMRLHQAAGKARIDREKLMRLEHAVLSHHGELEWGAPKRPSTFEALLLHHVDNLDAKAAGFSQLLRGASLLEERWTEASNLFRRPLYAPRAVEDDAPSTPTDDDQHYRQSA